jgi:hypothetical protein
MFAAISLGLLLACDGPNGKVDPVSVQWMDWPAEVNARQPFRTRLVVWGVCAISPQFLAGASSNQAAVTFAPYFTFQDDHILCAQATGSAFAVTALDTAGIAPGLLAGSPRTYEMRAPMPDFALDVVAGHLSVSAYGTVMVRPSGADASRRNAGGYATIERDSQNCLRVRPLGLYAPDAAIALDDQAAAGSAPALVRGYIYDAANPICGETRVFHRVTP